MRSQFDKQIKRLHTELIEMGGLIEIAIKYAIESLTEKDADKALKVKENEVEINTKEKEIENLCFKLLLHQQPVAKDLRLVSSALKMITDMERIGDYAEDIAELSYLLCRYDHIYKMRHIEKMASTCSEMVTGCINAFVDKNALKAATIIKSDDIVDEEFTSMKNELISVIVENREHSEQAIDLMMISKYLERIGDHAVNIAEWVIYSITGQKYFELEPDEDIEED